jgi:hypothetical protein
MLENRLLRRIFGLIGGVRGDGGNCVIRNFIITP